jgi:hypothetical protein
MERYCITKKQCKQLLDNELFGIFDETEDDVNLIAMIERARIYYDSEIVVFNYFMSKLLEQYLKHDPSKCGQIIEFLKVLPNNMYLTLEEFDRDFIDNLMTKSMPSSVNSLEDDLLEAINSYYG